MEGHKAERETVERDTFWSPFILWSRKNSRMRSFVAIALVLAVSVAVKFTPSMLTQQLLHPKGFTPAKGMNPLTNSIDSELFVVDVTSSLRYLRLCLPGHAVCL